MVRVLIPYHCKNKDDAVLDTDTISDTVNMCKSLHDLGYETSINIGRIDKLSENHIHELCSLVRDAPIKYLYIADTYGNLGIYKMRKIIATLKQYYTGAVGFHAHDNLQNASIKSIDALYNGASIVDVTFGGYGRGSGNAKAELVLAHMIMSGSEEYKLLPALVYADKYVQKYTQSGVVYLLTGMTSMHVNYAIEVIEKWPHLSIEKVYDTFGKIVESGKHNFYFPDVFTHTL
jgi:4-hydroxy 2-oxovalerate aldolase